MTISGYSIKDIKSIYDGRLLNISLKEVTFPDGRSALREIVVHPGAVGIVPFVDEAHIVLIEQFRTAAGRVLWEIPAGTIEKGESPMQCAGRELVEEIGYKAEKLERLADIFLAPGYSTEVMYLFAAYSLTKEAQRLEDDERIKPHIVSLDDARLLLTTGKIVDAKTIIGLSMTVEH